MQLDKLVCHTSAEYGFSQFPYFHRLDDAMLMISIRHRWKWQGG